MIYFYHLYITITSNLPFVASLLTNPITAGKNLENRKGEYIIDNINSVEDTKGNNGDRGTLVVTNLRILWICHRNTKFNLSIGFNTVFTISVKKAKSKVGRRSLERLERSDSSIPLRTTDH